MKVIENHPIKASWVVLTPKDAADLLKRRDESIQEIDYDHARRLLYDIKCGEWRENGDIITFDGKGRLIKGATELYAMVLAASWFPSIEFRCCIITGMDV